MRFSRILNCLLALGLASIAPVCAADTPYTLGIQAYKQGDFAKASGYFEEALKKTQSDPMLWYYDALCFHQLKNWSMAKSRYKTTATYFPATAAGKSAADALKKIDPSFVPPVVAAPAAAGAPGAGTTAAAGATGAGAIGPAPAGAAPPATGKTNLSDLLDSITKTEDPTAKEMEGLPDTAHFYFKKGPSGHMEVDLMVNGHPVKALFDTGASAFFYADQLKEAGLDLNAAKAGRGTRGWAGVAVATKVIPATVKLGTLSRNINITMQESTNAMGQNLIGQDMIRGYQYEIDDKGGRVDLKKSITLAAKDINPLYDIPLTVIGKDDCIGITVNNSKVMAFIDTGASSTIFDARTAAQCGIQPSGETVHMTGVGGNVTMQRAYVTIRIGGMLKPDFPVLIGGACGCALGQDLMDGWRYKVDREHKLLRFYH